MVPAFQLSVDRGYSLFHPEATPPYLPCMSKPHAQQSDSGPASWNAGLKPREMIFVENILKGNDLTKAAIAAGYSKKNASKSGSQLNKKPHIKAAIQKLMARAATRIDLSATNILQEVAAIAFSDMKNYATWGAGGVVIKESSQLTPIASAAVAEVYDGPKRGKGVRLYDKLAALKLLGEYAGVFNKDAISPAAGPTVKVYAGFDPSKV